MFRLQRILLIRGMNVGFLGRYKSTYLFKASHALRNLLGRICRWPPTPPRAHAMLLLQLQGQSISDAKGRINRYAVRLLPAEERDPAKPTRARSHYWWRPTRPFARQLHSSKQCLPFFLNRSPRFVPPSLPACLAFFPPDKMKESRLQKWHPFKKGKMWEGWEL